MNFSHPAVVGMIVAIPSITIAWLGYRRAMRVDRSTSDAAMVVAQTGSVGQIIDGLNRLIDKLQEDNTVWRDNFVGISARLEVCIAERDEVQQRLNALNKKYGTNGG